MVSAKTSKLTMIITVLLATLVFFSHSTVNAAGVKKGEAGNELSIEFYQEDVIAKEKEKEKPVNKTVANKSVGNKKLRLPQTGEVKKIIYVLLGMGMVLLVGLLTYKKRKKVGM